MTIDELVRWPLTLERLLLMKLPAEAACLMFTVPLIMCSNTISMHNRHSVLRGTCGCLKIKLTDIIAQTW